MTITPVRDEDYDYGDACSTPVRQHDAAPSMATDKDGDKDFKPYASQTDGYDSEDDFVDKQLDFSKLTSAVADEAKSEAVDQPLADIVMKNWCSEKSFENMKTVFQKYNCP